MLIFPFIQVDAFTDQPMGGNPCAVLLDAESLDEAQMQAIAREMNLAETAFVRRSDRADFGARFFTPEAEIPLAGHPSLAVAAALVDCGRLELAADSSGFTLELPAGIIPLEISSLEGKIQRITMTQIKPRFLRAYNPGEVLDSFNLSQTDLLPGAPVQTVSTGTPQLMVPLRDQAALRRANLDISAYRELRARGDFFSPHLFCLEGISPHGQTFARHFGIPPDLPEDPFTGSATGGMAAYLWRYGLIERPSFLAEQGHWLDRPGQAWVEVIGPPQDIAAVKVGGQTVVVLRGEFFLPDRL